LVIGVFLLAGGAGLADIVGGRSSDAGDRRSDG